MLNKKNLSRRHFLVGAQGLAGLVFTGCSIAKPQAVYEPLQQTKTDNFPPTSPQSVEKPNTLSAVSADYGAIPNERFPIPAADLSQTPAHFLRQKVGYQSPHKPGTLIVDTSRFYLHLIEKNGTAMRYGVGLGRAGFQWSGQGVIKWKKAWPTWTPPEEMIERDPSLEKWSADNGGMPPGLENPLGARALYIFQNGKDTLYRLHGTPEYWSIGKSVSSGCVRLMNHDIIDLYKRVSNGAKLIVT